MKNAEGINEEMRILSLAVEQSPISILITNRDGVIEYVNPQLKKITGYSREELIGKNPKILSSGFHDKEFYKQMWSELSKGRQWRCVFHNKKKDGSIYYESALISPIINDKGEITNFLGIKEDITEKLKTEQELINSEARLQAIIQNSYTAILIIWEDGIIMFSSPSGEKIHGYLESEVVGRNIIDFIYPDDIHIGKEIAGLLNDKGEDFVEKEIRLIHKNTNEPVWINLNVTRYPTQFSEDKASYLVLFQDITKQKTTENQLKNSILNRDKLFSIVSHDLRGPVGNMPLMLDMLIHQKDIDEDLKIELLKEIKRSISNVNDLIENLLKWAKLQSDSIHFEPSDFLIYDLINDITELYSFYARQKAIKIENIVNRSMVVNADRESIKLVVRNLVNNALKFTGKSGKIVIESYEEGDEVAVSVSDNGLGMEDHIKKNLFAPNKFVSTFGTSNEKGTGLGLALCKEFVVKNGGMLTVESEPGVGSTFRFTMRKGSSDSAIQLYSESLPKVEKESIIKDRKILLIEDDEINRAYTSILFNNWGLDYTLAEDGEKGLKYLGENSYDIIIMDLEMPVMDGFRTISAIRKTLKLNIPVIAASANDSESIIKKVSRAGFNDYIVKPYNPSYLLNKLVKNLKDPGYLGLNNIIKEKKPEISGRNICDLQKLNYIFSDNKKSVHEIIEKFLEVTPEYYNEALKTYERNDAVNLKKVMHKLKTSISLIATKDALADIIDIEEYSANNDFSSKLHAAFSRFKEWFPVLCEELRRDLSRL
jgi:PAS domain S-box-containing protein